MPSEIPNKSIPGSSMQPLRIGIFICLAISAGTAAAWMLECGGIQSFSGSLKARTTIVASNRPARVHEIYVATGQTVAPGEPLIQLIDAQLENRLAGKRREISEYEVEVGRSKASAEVELSWRRRELQSEIFETQLKIAALSQEKLNKQVEQIAWKERLSMVGFDAGPILAEGDHPFRSISMEIHAPDDRRLQAMLREDAAAASAEALATQIALCEQRLKKLETLDQELETRIKASSGAEGAEVRSNGAKQELAILETQAKDLKLTSSTYGTIGGIILQSGDLVSSGSTLIEILDETHPHVVAQIPSEAAAMMRPGSKVSLVFPMNQRRTGIVSTISPQTTSTPGTSESFVAVKIEPAGKLWPKLAIGSNIKVLLH